MSTSYQNTFLQGLSKNEIRIIEEHLKKQTIDSEENKDSKLFKILTSDSTKEFTESELEMLTDSKGTALRALRSRLFDKATEALIQDTYISDPYQFNPNDRVVFALRKKFLIYKILYPTYRKDGTQILLELLAKTG